MLRDKHGNIHLGHSRYIDINAQRKLMPSHKGNGILENSINRIGGVPDKDSKISRHQSYREPIEQEPSNYKAVPKILLGDHSANPTRMLRSVSMPTKKLNNLRFEL